MFRRTLTCALAIGCALSLSACNTPQTEAKIDVGIAAGTAVASAAGTVVQVSKVKSAAIKICGYEPAGATVVNIAGTLTGASAYTDIATYVADRICAAVTTKAAVVASLDGLPPVAYAQASSGSSNGSVNDVPVKGRFVGKKKSG